MSHRQRVAAQFLVESIVVLGLIAWTVYLAIRER